MEPADFNLRHLRALAATLRLGGLGAAAKAIGISQPAVTQAIARLEELTGTRLLDRGGAGVAATDAGVLLSARGEAAASVLAEALGPQRRGGIGARAGADTELSMAQVSALLALADSGSYAAGAASLGIAQPSLHRSVGTLEELCRVALTARRGRGTVLTAAGERLAAGFRLALAELQAALDELAVLGGRDQGAVRVGADAAALARLIPGAVTRFLAEHPPVRIQVQTARSKEDAGRLRDGRLDVLVTITSPAVNGSGLITEPLINDPLVIAGRTGHPLSGSAAPGLVRLAGFGWALPECGSAERDAWERLFLDGGLYPPAPNVICPSAPALLELVATSDLLTVAPQALIERSDKLVAIGQQLPTERSLVLVTRSGWAPTPAQATFLDEIRAGAREVLAF
jgi:DNA-binding transcriptional LysR family regulator